MKIFKSIKFKSLILIFILFSFSCSKPDDVIKAKELTYAEAAANLPIYDHFIKHFKNQGYTFWSFEKYWNSDKANLPKKLVIIRHDVHHRDIRNAYYAHLIEDNYIGFDAATYFVMLNFPLEKSYKNYEQYKKDYLDVIEYLKQRSVDVEPHISLWDEYVEQYSPWWNDLKLEQLKSIISKHYSYTIEGNYYKIIYKSTDTLNFKDVEKKLPDILLKYNAVWKQETGLDVLCYAAHGSESAINHAFNNVIITNLKQCRESGAFEFETSSPEIMDNLIFLSDNNRPLWMENPDSISSGRYQLLMHPDVWENPQDYRDKYWK